MTRQEIFRKAWSIARLGKYKKILWFGFIPAFLTTVVSSIVYSFRGYQYWVELFEGRSILEVASSFSSTFFGFLGGQPLLTFVFVVCILLFALCYMMLPVFLHGGLIKLTEQAIYGEPIRLRNGLIYSSEHFLKLFENDAITYPFKLSLIFMVFWMVNTFAPPFLPFILLPLACWLIVSLIITVLLLFTDYYIVLRGEGIFPSFMASMRTVFLNLEEVVHMVFLMLLIALRVLLNTAISLGLPIVVLYIFSSFTSPLLSWLAWPTAVFIGLIALIFLSYINAIFSVFLTAAWTLTFMKYTDTLPPEESPAKEASVAEGQLPLL